MGGKEKPGGIVPQPATPSQLPSVSSLLKEKPRPLLLAKRLERAAMQAALMNTRADLVRIEGELSKLRADEMWLEDHPEAEKVFDAAFLARFVGQSYGEEVTHGVRQEER